MPEIHIEPTCIGKNEKFKFIVPDELFNIGAGPELTLDKELARKFGNYLNGTFRGFQQARKTKYGNEENTKTEVPAGFWEDFEKKAKEMDVDLIGYTPLLPDFVFYDLKVYGKNAIVLGMEMKWDEIKKAPNIDCEIECFRVYYLLGKVTIKLTKYLKELGYKSEAHHPFGGKMLFPPHAVAAGLGIKGRNGLVITPEFGPRQRWAIITTDAEIPEPPKRDFREMKEYCQKCGLCIKQCKGGAAFEEPIKRIDGLDVITHIDRSKCIQSILKNNYCSVCLKICPRGRKKEV
ncbi:MAG: hypothetical protein ACFFCS_08620 [Candidatus Hodarchaeota archaeon]